MSHQDRALREIWMALRVIANEQHSVGSDTFNAAWSRLLDGWSPPPAPPNLGFIRSNAEIAQGLAQTETSLAVHNAINSVRNSDSGSLRSAARRAAEVCRKILGEPPTEAAHFPQTATSEAPLHEPARDTNSAKLKPVEMGAIRLFYSYSHKDEELRKELEDHLSTLRSNGVIAEWHDRGISPGENWAKKITDNLDEADIILLLISADFLSSGYCRGKEMKRAIERNEAGEARVIPIILRSVDWQGEPISKLQALPTDVKPVTSWPNRDEAWTDVAIGIRRAVTELLGSRHFRAGKSDQLEIGPPPAQSEAWKSALLDVAEFLNTYSECRKVPPGAAEGSSFIGETPGDDWEVRYYLHGHAFEGLNARLGVAIMQLKAAGMRPPLKRIEPAKAIHVAYDTLLELAGELRRAWTIRCSLRLPRTPNEIAAIVQAATDDSDSSVIG